MAKVSRRTFLGGLAGALGGLGRAQAPGIKLGFDTYSLRAFRWKDIQLLNYAAGLKLDAIQISGLGEFESLDPVHLERVKDHAARFGIQIDAGIGCICSSSRSWRAENGTPEQYLLKGLRVAKALGAGSMRCFLGASADRRAPGGIERHIANTVRELRRVRSQALDSGVRIAVENHSGDLQARELKLLIEGAGKDYVAACLDTGNPMWVLEDPLLTLEVLGPYTVTTHIRDSVVFEHPRGLAWQWVALGDGVIDWRKFAARFRELCPNAAMQLENITGRPPHVMPYFEAEFWQTLPKMPASELARFAALAKRGRPFMGTMIIADAGTPPPEYIAALREQQRRDLERGIEYARRVLGIGVRWQATGRQ